MPISPLLLEIDGYHVLDIRLTANTGYDNDKPSVGGVDVDFDVYPHPEEPRRFHVSMSIDIAGDETSNEPYALHLQLSGFFSFKPESTEETVTKMLFSNAVPILYGIARGCVGQVTGNALNGALMLPAFNFVELAQKKAERAHRETLTVEATPEPAAQLPSAAAENAHDR